MRIKPEEIIGAQFGRLRVVKCLGYIKRQNSEKHDWWYECLCLCGNAHKVRRDHLLSGRVQSCGDCHKILAEDGHFRYVCHSGDSFLFDKEDYELISKYRWHVFHSDGKRYVARRDENRKYILLSHEMIPVKCGEYIDHINGDTLDYRRNNLRPATSETNTWNNSIRKDNRSGYKGVHYSKNGFYYASINYHKETIRLGKYKTPEEAARAYDEAARFYFGEFACVNFPLPGEQGCRRNLEGEKQADVA